MPIFRTTLRKLAIHFMIGLKIDILPLGGNISSVMAASCHCVCTISQPEDHSFIARTSSVFCHSSIFTLVFTENNANFDAVSNKRANFDEMQFFTARCTLVQSAVLRSHVVCLSVCPSVCLSVTLVNCDHIGWNSSKLISPLVSLGCSLFATPT